MRSKKLTGVILLSKCDSSDILQLNRDGFAVWPQCPACGDTLYRSPHRGCDQRLSEKWRKVQESNLPVT